jgi:endonuclease/exonuclease/phosphatase family metal-dependent hydrolase
MMKRALLLALAIVFLALPSAYALTYDIFGISSPQPFSEYRGGETFYATGSFIRSDDYVPTANEILISFNGVNYVPSMSGSTWTTDLKVPVVDEPRELEVKAWVSDKDGIKKETVMKIYARPELLVSTVTTDKSVYLGNEIMDVNITVVDAQGRARTGVLVAASLEGTQFKVTELSGKYNAKLDLSKLALKEGQYNIKIHAAKAGYFQAQEYNKQVTIGKVISTIDFWNEQRTQVLDIINVPSRPYIGGTIYSYGWTYPEGNLTVMDGSKVLFSQMVPISNGTWGAHVNLPSGSTYLVASFSVPTGKAEKIIEVGKQDIIPKADSASAAVSENVTIKVSGLSAASSMKGIIIFSFTDGTRTIADSMNVDISSVKKDITRSWPAKEFSAGNVQCSILYLKSDGQLQQIAYTNFDMPVIGEPLIFPDAGNGVSFSNTHQYGKPIMPAMIVWNKTNAPVASPTYVGTWMNGQSQASSPVSSESGSVAPKGLGVFKFQESSSSEAWGVSPEFKTFMSSTEYSKKVSLTSAEQPTISINMAEVKAHEKTLISINTGTNIPKKVYLEEYGKERKLIGTEPQISLFNVNVSPANEGLFVLTVQENNAEKRFYILSKANPVISSKIAVASEATEGSATQLKLTVANTGSPSWIVNRIQVGGITMDVPMYIGKETRTATIPFTAKDLEAGVYTITLSVLHNEELKDQEALPLMLESKGKIYLEGMKFSNGLLSITVNATELEGQGTALVKAKTGTNIQTFTIPIPKGRIVTVSESIGAVKEVSITLQDEKGITADMAVLNVPESGMVIKMSGWQTGISNANIGTYPSTRDLSITGSATLKVLYTGKPDSTTISKGGNVISKAANMDTYGTEKVVALKKMGAGDYKVECSYTGVKMTAKEKQADDVFEGNVYALTFTNSADKPLKARYYWGPSEITSQEGIVSKENGNHVLEINIGPNETKTVIVREQPSSIIVAAKQTYYQARTNIERYGPYALMGFGAALIILFLVVFVRTRGAKKRVRRFYGEDGEVYEAEVEDEEPIPENGGNGEDRKWIKWIILAAIIIVAVIVLFWIYTNFLSNLLSPSDGAVVAADMLKIGAWNVQIFGQATISNPAEMAVISSVVTQYDLIAIQEIRDSSGKTVPALMKTLPAHYSVQTSPRLGRTSSTEQYAFIWDNRDFDMKSIEVYPDQEDKFEREPYIGLFEVKGKGVQFVAMVVHVKPGDAPSEIKELENVVQYARAKYGPNIILMGDLNADCSYYKDNNQHLTDMSWKINSSADTTVSNTTCAYDRIIISKPFSENFSVGKTIRFDEGMVQSEALGVSDHYPVYVEYQAN